MSYHLYINIMIRKLFFLETWTLAFTEEYKDIKSLNGCKWEILKPNILDYFADPSIINFDKSNETVEVLYESINFLSGKGYIKKLVYSLIEKKIDKSENFLKNNFHISFPNKFEVNEEEFLVYENEEEGLIGVASFNDINFKIVASSPKKYLDPIIIKVKSDYLFIYSYRSEGELKFEINYINKDFELIESEMKYMHNSHSTRNAGKAIFENDKIYRPGQINDERYGEGIVFNELCFTDGSVEEKEFHSIKYHELFKDSTGLHTISIMENICIVDLRIKKFNPLAFLIKFMRRSRKYVKQ